jgi:hypothetical protein
MEASHVRSVSDSDNSLQLFLNGFTARDLAESLPSFDKTATSAAILAAMTAQRLEVFGVRKSGVIAGWLNHPGGEFLTRNNRFYVHGPRGGNR